MPRLILSPIGTSLFTNKCSGDKRIEMGMHANDSEKELPQSLKEYLTSLGVAIREELPRMDTHALRKSSAELNSLLGIYKKGWTGNKRDIHFLIATDTYQGRATASVIQDYLKRTFDAVEVIIPPHLNTRSKANFRDGIKWLLEWCDKTLEGYKLSEYEIIFNLTGGFKSLQGYLNTIGMFYADKITYIFERSEELIYIPRLPIEIDIDLFEENASLFLQLHHTGEGIEGKRIEDIPQVMLEEYERSRYVLSDWGELSWNKSKRLILSEQLLGLPLIHYENSFIKDYHKMNEIEEKVRLQEKVAAVSCLLQENNGDIAVLKAGRAGGMLYNNYTGRNSHLGHFRINRGLRVSCEYKDGTLFLRHYGQHDYVNDNP